MTLPPLPCAERWGWTSPMCIDCRAEGALRWTEWRAHHWPQLLWFGAVGEMPYVVVGICRYGRHQYGLRLHLEGAGTPLTLDRDGALAAIRERIQ